MSDFLALQRAQFQATGSLILPSVAEFEFYAQHPRLPLDTLFVDEATGMELDDYVDVRLQNGGMKVRHVRLRRMWRCWVDQSSMSFQNHIGDAPSRAEAWVQNNRIGRAGYQDHSELTQALGCTFNHAWQGWMVETLNPLHASRAVRIARAPAHAAAA